MISAIFFIKRSGANPISYDANGNMTSLPDKGISVMKYNILNLVNRQKLSDSQEIKYLYRADGAKVKKTLSTDTANGLSVETTDYIDGFQYRMKANNVIPPMIESTFAMEYEAFDVLAQENLSPEAPSLMFFPTAEGFYDYQKKQYIYQYKDHLGNVRISYMNKGGVAKILDQNNFYPFGMNHLNNGLAVFGSSSWQNYKYNAKELQETGMYDYGWRQYLPELVRWNGIDQLAEN